MDFRTAQTLRPGAFSLLTVWTQLRSFFFVLSHLRIFFFLTTSNTVVWLEMNPQ